MYYSSCSIHEIPRLGVCGGIWVSIHMVLVSGDVYVYHLRTCVYHIQCCTCSIPHTEVKSAEHLMCMYIDTPHMVCYTYSIQVAVRIVVYLHVRHVCGYHAPATTGMIHGIGQWERVHTPILRYLYLVYYLQICIYQYIYTMCYCATVPVCIRLCISIAIYQLVV